MKTKEVVREVLSKEHTKDLFEMADAHCHLDLMDPDLVKESVKYGVKTIITAGVDTKSNARNLELADGKNIFALLGIDPEHADVSDEELEFNIKMIRQSARKITGIGEIGLDYGKVMDTVPVEKQKKIFGKFLDLAKELDLPVSIHSRNAFGDVLEILDGRKIKSAHFHFFEGDVQQAKEIERRGYMISVPPQQSDRRSKVIKEMAIDNIMAETDSPIVGASPRDVERSIGMIREIKKIEFRKAANLLAQNTKRFFRIKANGLMRY